MWTKVFEYAIHSCGYIYLCGYKLLVIYISVLNSYWSELDVVSGSTRMDCQTVDIVNIFGQVPKLCGYPNICIQTICAGTLQTDHCTDC